MPQILNSTIIGVIIGGLIGIIASIITPLITTWRQQVNFEKNKKIADLERLILLVKREINNWANLLSSYYFNNTPIIDPENPINEINTLVTLYFPKITESLSNLEVAILELNVVFTSYSVQRNKEIQVIQNKVSNKQEIDIDEFDSNFRDTFLKEYRTAYQNLLKQQNIFISKIIEYYSVKNRQKTKHCWLKFWKCE